MYKRDPKRFVTFTKDGIQIKGTNTLMEGDWMSLNDTRKSLGLRPVQIDLTRSERNDHAILEKYISENYPPFPEELMS